MELYVIKNEAMPGLLKVGLTRDSADERAKTLTSSASAPHKFEVVNTYEFPQAESLKDLIALERSAHQRLAQFRYSPHKEFFTCTPQQAHAVIEKLQQEAAANIAIGLTAAGQPRQATMQTLLTGDKGRKLPLIDTTKPRNHWHVWIATSPPDEPTSTLQLFPHAYWSKSAARTKSQKMRSSGSHSTISPCEDPHCSSKGLNGPRAPQHTVDPESPPRPAPPS